MLALALLVALGLESGCTTHIYIGCIGAVICRNDPPPKPEPGEKARPGGRGKCGAANASKKKTTHARCRATDLWWLARSDAGCAVDRR